MKKNVKRKWLNALRTGVLSDGRKVKQSQHALKRGRGYCCLGVLCEEAVIAGVIDKPKRRTRGGGRVWFYGPGADDSNTLPTAVQNWAGLGSGDPRPLSNSLAQLNDYYGKTFEEIADIIDEGL